MNSKVSQENLVSSVYHYILRGDIISQNKVAGKIMSSFIGIGILTHLVLHHQRSSHGHYGPATALIWGYSIIILSIVCVVFLNNVGKKTISIFKLIPIDVLATLILMLWMISLNSSYLVRINQGNVSSDFYSYSYISSWIILAQILFFLFTTLLKNLLTNVSGEYNVVSQDIKMILNKVSFINYILIILNFMFILAQQLILNNFSVDVL